MRLRIYRPTFSCALGFNLMITEFFIQYTAINELNFL